MSPASTHTDTRAAAHLACSARLPREASRWLRFAEQKAVMHPEPRRTEGLACTLQLARCIAGDVSTPHAEFAGVDTLLDLARVVAWKPLRDACSLINALILLIST